MFEFQKDFSESQRGASLLEVILAMAVVAVATPTLYGIVADTTREIRDINIARQIITSREAAINFVRINQDYWPNSAQIKLEQDEIEQIAIGAHAAFIDKYVIGNDTLVDIYMAFNINDDTLRTAQIVRQIGGDSALVTDDGIAYAASWAASAPDFAPGDLVYRVSYDLTDSDVTNYLHRGTMGENNLNVMATNLNMGDNDIYKVGTVTTESTKFISTSAAFVTADSLRTDEAYFTNGANLDGTSARFSSMRVSGDITGFRTITAPTLNRAGFGTNGSAIIDRATVNNSVNVGRQLSIKSDTVRTVAGFVGISAHSVATPYLYSDEITFLNNYGLVVSGELLMSTTPPIKIGSWIFPSLTPPKFSAIEFTRTPIPATPNPREFEDIMSSGWRSN